RFGCFEVRGNLEDFNNMADGGEHANIAKERCFNCDSMEHRSSECPKHDMKYRFCNGYGKKDRGNSIRGVGVERGVRGGHSGRGNAHNVFGGRGFGRGSTYNGGGRVRPRGGRSPSNAAAAMESILKSTEFALTPVTARDSSLNGICLASYGRVEEKPPDSPSEWNVEPSSLPARDWNKRYVVSANRMILLD
ncbi:hypothetical protein PMAYCL1PPCAC_24964, partial [Pristionchus mayeri]